MKSLESHQEMLIKHIKEKREDLLDVNLSTRLNMTIQDFSEMVYMMIHHEQEEDIRKVMQSIENKVTKSREKKDDLQQ